MNITLNGEAAMVPEDWADETLLHVLREYFGLVDAVSGATLAPIPNPVLVELGPLDPKDPKTPQGDLSSVREKIADKQRQQEDAAMRKTGRRLDARSSARHFRCRSAASCETCIDLAFLHIGAGWKRRQALVERRLDAGRIGFSGIACDGERLAAASSEIDVPAWARLAAGLTSSPFPGRH